MFNWQSRIVAILVCGLSVGLFYQGTLHTAIIKASPMSQSNSTTVDEVYAYIQDDGGIQYTETEDEEMVVESTQQTLSGDPITVITQNGEVAPATPEQERELVITIGEETLDIPYTDSSPSTNPKVLYIYDDKPNKESFNFKHGIIGSLLGWLLTHLFDGIMLLIKRVV